MCECVGVLCVRMQCENIPSALSFMVYYYHFGLQQFSICEQWAHRNIAGTTPTYCQTKRKQLKKDEINFDARGGNERETKGNFDRINSNTNSRSSTWMCLHTLSDVRRFREISFSKTNKIERALRIRGMQRKREMKKKRRLFYTCIDFTVLYRIVARVPPFACNALCCGSQVVRTVHWQGEWEKLYQLGIKCYSARARESRQMSGILCGVMMINLDNNNRQLQINKMEKRFYCCRWFWCCVCGCGCGHSHWNGVKMCGSWVTTKMCKKKWTRDEQDDNK